MALNVIAHWSLNDPTTLSRLWDSSGNGHHGDFRAIKPAVVADSPCGSLAMKWVEGASATIPSNLNPVAISYWKKEEGVWHSYAYSDGKEYVDGEESGSKAVKAAEAEITNLLLGNTVGVVLSDIYFYGEALSLEEIQKIVSVKTKITKDKTLYAKEFVEEKGKVQILKAGIVNCEEIEDRKEKAAFSKEGKVLVNNIIEF